MYGPDSFIWSTYNNKLKKSNKSSNKEKNNKIKATNWGIAQCIHCSDRNIKCSASDHSLFFLWIWEHISDNIQVFPVTLQIQNVNKYAVCIHLQRNAFIIPFVPSFVSPFSRRSLSVINVVFCGESCSFFAQSISLCFVNCGLIQNFLRKLAGDWWQFDEIRFWITLRALYWTELIGWFHL